MKNQIQNLNNKMNKRMMMIFSDQMNTIDDNATEIKTITKALYFHIIIIRVINFIY